MPIVGCRTSTRWTLHLNSRHVSKNWQHLWQVARFGMFQGKPQGPQSEMIINPRTQGVIVQCGCLCWIIHSCYSSIVSFHGKGPIFHNTGVIVSSRLDGSEVVNKPMLSWAVGNSTKSLGENLECRGLRNTLGSRGSERNDPLLMVVVPHLVHWSVICKRPGYRLVNWHGSGKCRISRSSFPLEMEDFSLLRCICGREMIRRW